MCKRYEFNPWVGKILCSRKWQLAPVFLPGKFHEQTSLVGYSLWGHKESDTTKHTALILFSHHTSQLLLNNQWMHKYQLVFITLFVIFNLILPSCFMIPFPPSFLFELIHFGTLYLFFFYCHVCCTPFHYSFSNSSPK